MATPRALWWSWGGGRFLMSEVPLYIRLLSTRFGSDVREQNLSVAPQVLCRPTESDVEAIAGEHRLSLVVKTVKAL